MCAWTHVVWAILRQNRSMGVTSRSVREKMSESHRDSHRKDMSPLTQCLNYRSACDFSFIKLPSYTVSRPHSDAFFNRLMSPSNYNAVCSTSQFLSHKLGCCGDWQYMSIVLEELRSNIDWCDSHHHRWNSCRCNFWQVWVITWQLFSSKIKNFVFFVYEANFRFSSKTNLLGPYFWTISVCFMMSKLFIWV